MRPIGETGVQTHVNCFSSYLAQQQISHQLITPFSFYLWLVYPVFAIRKLIHLCSGQMSVWWYRYWHGYFLQLALQKHLKIMDDCVIYAQCPVSAHAALKARRSDRQRVIMVTHFNISQADEWVGKGLIAKQDKLYQAIQNFENAVLTKLDGIVYVSEFMRNQLFQRIPALSSIDHIVVPNFLPDPGLTKTERFSADLISIGTLETRKNQRYLLEILAAIRDLGYNTTLTIVGDGPDRAMLEHTVNTLNITNLVTFSGFIKNAAALIASHKALIHVATIENLPLTLLEAIARGRPVFAVPVGGIPEILTNDDVGIALPENNPILAAKLIVNALYDQEWLIKTGEAARTRFLKHYVNEISAQRLVRFLTA